MVVLVLRLCSVLLLLAALVVASCDTATDGDIDTRTEITLLVAYTPAAREAVADIEGHIRRSIEETNALYANGAIPIRLVPAHLVEVDHVVTDRDESLRALLRTQDGVLDTLHTLRDRHAADVVILVPGSRNTRNAAVMAEASTAFALVYWDGLGAPGYALGHELGHLQGARHAFADDASVEPFAYGHGFKNDTLRTIMANGAQQVVPYVSGPDQVYQGVVLGDASTQDVARVLRESAVYISNFRGPQTPTDFVPPALFPRYPDLER